MDSNVTFNEIDQTVLKTLESPSRFYWLSIVLLFCGVLIGAACWLYQILIGIGVGGQNNPVAWGTYLINYFFWV